MMHLRKICLLAACLMVSQISRAQAPFTRGVNLTGWFQASGTRQIQFARFTKKDFVNIKSLGCDVIRLPINLHAMTSGSPNYTIDPLFISFLDSAVNWAEQLHIYLIIDNHSFDPSVNTSADIGQVLVKVWPQLAEHYKYRSNYIYYEILNEPHGISDQLWGSIQQEAINAIRSRDTKHTIIVGGSGFNSYNNLDAMPVYSDTNLIYTFHFYDPFMFTHQGAGWVTPSMVPLAGVPFPYNAAHMPACPSSCLGTWVEDALNNYPFEGNVAKVKSLIDIAVNFRNSRNVKIFCGEFGVYIPNSDTTDRAYWYQVVRTYLEEKGIPWTTWDYTGGFGLFKKGSNELFNYDLNILLLQKLGFNIPPQQTWLMKPDSTGFNVFTDYLEQGLIESSYTTGTLDYYSQTLPNNGNYCLYWSGGNQYSAVSMDLSPNKDLTTLVDSNYAIDFLVRGNTAGIQFDLRFLDTKTDDPADHPWRMRTTLTDASSAWDKKWHHLHIPLSTFAESGSWDNGTWYNPEGKFDWAAVDKLEIVAEEMSLEGKDLWFDNIIITNLDTALVRQTGTLGIRCELADNPARIRVFPNPMHEQLTLSYSIPETSQVDISIFSMSGARISTLLNQSQLKGNYSLNWDGKNESGIAVPTGNYICRLRTDLQICSVKINKISVL